VETAARAPFGALVKLANDKTGYRVSAAGLQAGWQRSAAEIAPCRLSLVAGVEFLEKGATRY
jgi:hypothetical protein